MVRRCVGFSEDSISGKDVLDRAGVDPVYRDYYGEAFVCSLLGVGNSLDRCPNSDASKNWSYWQAPAGTSSFSLSTRGVSTTTIHDGDVEGWKWASSAPPPYVPASDVCPPTATTAVTRAPTSATTTTASPRAGVTSRNPTSGTVTSTSTIEAPTTTTPAPDSSTTGPGTLALPVKDKSGAGSPAGLIAVGALIAGIGVVVWRINRRRPPGG